MRIPRPSLRRRRPNAEEEASALARIAPEDDARLLRRTRLRLMAVSGAVTLVLLVLFAAAVYTATSNAYKSDSVTRLRSYADLWASRLSGTVLPGSQTGSVDPEFGGQFAGLYVVAVNTEGDTLPISRYV